MVMLEHNVQRWHSSIGIFCRRSWVCTLKLVQTSWQVVPVQSDMSNAFLLMAARAINARTIKHSEVGIACETAPASTTHVYRICENLKPICQQVQLQQFEFPGVYCFYPISIQSAGRSQPQVDGNANGRLPQCPQKPPRRVKRFKSSDPLRCMPSCTDFEARPAALCAGPRAD